MYPACNQFMMQYSLCLFMSFLVSMEVFAQETIVLKTVPFEIEDQSFYIKQVIDDRKESHLGYVKDKEGNKVSLKLTQGASKAVQGFIDISFPYVENNQPIYVKIKALEIQESRISVTEMTARAHVELAFFKKQRVGLKELFSIEHNENQIFASPIFALLNEERIFETHEKRIRAALEYCMLAFIDNYQKDNKDSGPTHFTKDRSESELNSKLGNWFNLITFRKIISSTYHEGWAIGYTGFADREKGFIVPYEINLEQYSVKSDFAKDSGYESVDSYVLRPGLYGYKKILPGIYASLGLNIPIGVEVLQDTERDESNNFVVGIGASQGVKIIPWEDFGIVIGVDFFQQIQTSEIYKRDLGFELILGVNF